MKILNGTLFQRVGGVETMFRNYSKALQMNNGDFDLLISSRTADSFLEEEVYEKCGAKKIFKIWHKAVTFDFLQLLAVILFSKHEVIICHQPRLMKWAAIINKTLGKIQKLLGIKPVKSVAIVHGLGIRLALKCDYVIAVNSEIATMIAKEGFNPNKIFVLANAIELSEPYQAKSISKNKGTSEKPRFFEEFLDSQICEKASVVKSTCSRVNLDNAHKSEAIATRSKEFKNLTRKLLKKDGFAEVPKPLIIGAYGRIEHGKGFDILLEAAKILQEMGVDFRLKIGGTNVNDHYNSKTLEQIVKKLGLSEIYDFVGEVSNKKKFFEDIDIFCVPSRHESFGLVILEGFLFSTPVISSATDGGKILIKHFENGPVATQQHQNRDGLILQDQQQNTGENGLLFEPENPQDLAQKIADIAYQKIDSKKLTKAAYSRLEEEFSLPIFAKNLDKILQKIADDEF